MVKRKMYKKIQSMKNKGMLVAEIARELGIDRRTVGKYFSMNEAQYKEYEKSMSDRSRLLDDFKPEILRLYETNNFRKLNMAAVFDYLEEKHGALPCTEKSLRNYVKSLVQKGELILKESVRLFSKVPPLAFGKQMQLDFGEFVFPSGLKVYIFAAVLSASRYKYVTLQAMPFKTIHIIRHLLACFEYFGGIPEEIVIDQDATLVVSENAGDIIYTNQFKEFMAEMGFKMYVCRKADPQSKGKIENLIGFVKKNFLQVRDFAEITEACESLFHWLTRRANGKISQATGLIPAEVIQEERQHLQSLRCSIFQKDDSILRDTRKVNQHGFISFQSSLYSVPKHYIHQDIEIFNTEELLLIYDKEILIAEHKIAKIPGQKVITREHFREPKKKIQELKDEVLNMFSFSLWQSFAMESFRHFPRYVRDQCMLAKKHFSETKNISNLEAAIEFCLENKSHSFKDLHDSVISLVESNICDHEKPSVLPLPQIPSVDVQQRMVCEYEAHIHPEVAL